MSIQSNTALTSEQVKEHVEEAFAWKLEVFLHSLLIVLDAYLDKRLVRTFLKSIAGILCFRNFKQGLYLSELGAYLGEPSSCAAGTKRISRLFHSLKWGKEIIEEFLWERADQRLCELETQGKLALCIWDGSVIEKPESDHTEGMCAVTSSKAARLSKQRKGVFNPPGGKPITVLGMEWTGILLLGMHGIPLVVTMCWWSRKGERATTGREVEKRLRWKVMMRWGKRVIHVFDRGYAGGPWLSFLGTLRGRCVIRWKKGHLFFDHQGQKKKLWEIARGKSSWGHRMMWDEKTHEYRKMGVLALPVRHAEYAGPLWLVVGRTGKEPWYLITNQRIETEEQAWEIISIYAMRWRIQMSFRYGKSELAMESVRVKDWEVREKLLLLVTLAYSYLLSLLDPGLELMKEWLLREYCHRTGKRCRKASAPLYRIRWALSRCWSERRPVFTGALFSPESNPRSQNSG